MGKSLTWTAPQERKDTKRCCLKLTTDINSILRRILEKFIRFDKVINHGITITRLISEWYSVYFCLTCSVDQLSLVVVEVTTKGAELILLLRTNP